MQPPPPALVVLVHAERGEFALHVDAEVGIDPCQRVPGDGVLGVSGFGQGVVVLRLVDQRLSIFLLGDNVKTVALDRVEVPERGLAALQELVKHHRARAHHLVPEVPLGEEALGHRLEVVVNSFLHTFDSVHSFFLCCASISASNLSLYTPDSPINTATLVGSAL